MSDRALTIKQPWASLIMAGVKDVENRTWSVPKTLPQWGRCAGCNNRVPPSSWSGGAWHRRLPPNPQETCGPVDWSNGPFPFRLWVHAGKTLDKAGNRAVLDWAAGVNAATRAAGRGPLRSPIGSMFRFQEPRGFLLGTVLVTGCHCTGDCFDLRYADGRRPPMEAGWCSPWAEPDAYHWTLTDPQPLAVPIPMKGRQGLWRLPSDVPDLPRLAYAVK